MKMHTDFESFHKYISVSNFNLVEKYKIQQCIFKLASKRERKAHQSLTFFLFLMFVQMGFIFVHNVRIFSIYDKLPPVTGVSPPMYMYLLCIDLNTLTL